MVLPQVWHLTVCPLLFDSHQAPCLTKFCLKEEKKFMKTGTYIMITKNIQLVTFKLFHWNAETE